MNICFIKYNRSEKEVKNDDLSRRILGEGRKPLYYVLFILAQIVVLTFFLFNTFLQIIHFACGLLIATNNLEYM